MTELDPDSLRPRATDTRRRPENSAETKALLPIGSDLPDFDD